MTSLTIILVGMAVAPAVVDGQGTWDRLVPNTTGQFLSQGAIGAGGAVLVGTGGTVLTSEEGVVWTPRETATSAAVADILWTGEDFVAVGDRVVLISKDGSSWQQEQVPASLNAVGWNGELFVALAPSAILTGIDAREWEYVPDAWLETPCAVAWGGGAWVATGEDLLSSENGRDWTLVAEEAWMTDVV